MISNVPLGSVAQINPRLPRGIDETQDVSFLAMASVSEEGRVTAQETRVLSDTRKGYTYFEREDVLLAKITPCFENGKAALVDDLEHQVGFGSTEFHVLRADPERLDPKYLFYMIWNDRFRFLGGKSMQGAAGQKRVSADFLKKFEIPLPALVEQQRIAGILDKADALRRKRQQAMDLADQFLRSVFLDMFGDPVSNPKGWPVYRMGDVIDFKGGNQPPKSTFEYEPKEGNVRLMQIRDFKTDKYATYIPKEKAKRHFGKDDVMIARYGPPVFQILRGLEGSYNVALMKASPKIEITKDFIFRVLQIPAYHDTVVANSERTAGQTGLNLDLLNNFDLPLPPLSVQEEIGRKTTHMERIVEQHKRALSESEYLFGSLSQQAFRGEL